MFSKTNKTYTMFSKKNKTYTMFSKKNKTYTMFSKNNKTVKAYEHVYTSIYALNGDFLIKNVNICC